MVVVLVAADVTGVDLDPAQVEGFHSVEDEVYQMIGGHPVAEIRRQSGGVSRSMEMKRVTLCFGRSRHAAVQSA